MTRHLIFLFIAFMVSRTLNASESSPEILVVVGAPGGEEFGKAFQEAANRWREAFIAAEASLNVIGIEQNDSSDRDQIKTWIESRIKSSGRPIWLVMIGHGTYARDVAKFNLRGPDVSASELSTWLAAVERPIAIINGASASGPFINRLSAAGRVIVTATKSGNEQNYVRFGNFFAAAIASLDSDLDHDDEVSIQEAFVKASADVKRFYDSKDRIATEHALIDDNGDGLGTPASMFRGLRMIETPKAGTAIDGDVASRMTWSPSGVSLPWSAAQLERRASIEADFDSLRSEQSLLNPDEYYKRLEPLMIDLARLYREAETRSDADSVSGRVTAPTNDADASDDDSE